jgi:hypothetical protein
MLKDHGKTAEANAQPVYPEQSEVVEEAPSTHTIDRYDGQTEEPRSAGSVTQGLCARLTIMQVDSNDDDSAIGDLSRM